MTLHYAAVPHSEDDSENSDDDSANERLLPSNSSPAHDIHSDVTPFQTWCKTNWHKSNRKRSDKNCLVEIKLSPLTQTNAKKPGKRQINSEKLKRWLNIGAVLFALLFIIYLCFSMNLSFEKQAAQIVVEIPPVDASITGPKGELCVCCLSVHCLL